VRPGAHLLGMSVTVLLHAGLVFVAITRGDALGCGGGGTAEASDFEEAETIEAALAFKKIAPKDRQPQKQKKEKYAPVDGPKLATDPTTKPEVVPEKDKPKMVPREDEIDPASILRKNREQDESLSSTGAEELPVEGADDGSEWGTERDAKGDPYVGELTGRIKSAWTVPSLEQGSGAAVGCVRLDKAGKIQTRELKDRSKNANLDRSVEEALSGAPDMETPVPDHLVKLLTVKGICINFKL
jgi:hypothetical protein